MTASPELPLSGYTAFQLLPEPDELYGNFSAWAVSGSDSDAAGRNRDGIRGARSRPMREEVD